MSIRSRVSELIKNRIGTSLCDTCIHKEVGASRSMVNEAARYLAKGGSVLGFSRFQGKCSICGNKSLVIRAENSN